MEITTPSRSFGAYHLSIDTLRSLEAKGYRSPTDVQHETIPLLNRERPCLGNNSCLFSSEGHLQHVPAIMVTGFPFREFSLPEQPTNMRMVFR